MPAAHQFEYLPLILRDRGPAYFPPAAASPRSGHNEQQEQPGRAQPWAENRRSRRSSLAGRAEKQQRLADGLPTIEAGIPLLLKIDTSLDLDDLRHYFQFEIISEQEDGFVIVASEDISLASFQQKLNEFVANVPRSGSANVARIHELREDPTQEERLRRILTDTLFNEWPTLGDDQPYICDVSISCRRHLADSQKARNEAVSPMRNGHARRGHGHRPETRHTTDGISSRKIASMPSVTSSPIITVRFCSTSMMPPSMHRPCRIASRYG